jgi:hypothetical protein
MYDGLAAYSSELTVAAPLTMGTKTEERRLIQIFNAEDVTNTQCHEHV